jgi:antitoxin (DNA-binding transcriptional repressor) of toxin-antitoxin stability system
MKTASIRDLRYRFPQIEARLREGEAIDITKRKRVIARLVPVKPRPQPRAASDFLAMLKDGTTAQRTARRSYARHLACNVRDPSEG